MPIPKIHIKHIQKFSGENNIPKEDVLVTEEPLEIQISEMNVDGIYEHKNVAITMRTPGNDVELAMGFLFSEAIITDTHDVHEVTNCKQADEPENVIRVFMKKNKHVDWKKLQRNFFVNSSCGVCGKQSIEQLQCLIPEQKEASLITLRHDQVFGLTEKLKLEQTVFQYTGGIHGTAIFNDDLEMQCVFEDIGRHNALDKAIGDFVFNKKRDLTDCIGVISGRAGFELVQKSVQANLAILIAVGAPSHLAVELADEFNLTLIGFAKQNSFNIYTHPQRIIGPTS